jgi:hypothetical protein
LKLFAYFTAQDIYVILAVSGNNLKQYSEQKHLTAKAAKEEAAKFAKKFKLSHDLCYVTYCGKW